MNPSTESIHALIERIDGLQREFMREMEEHQRAKVGRVVELLRETSSKKEAAAK